MNRGLYPHIAIGHYDGVAYRLVPSTTLLEATRDIDWEDTRYIYPPMFLGINVTVTLKEDHAIEGEQATRRQLTRKENRTEKSKKSGDSHSTDDDTGFVFYQLGALEYTTGLQDVKTTDIDLLASKTWIDSNFVLVAKIGASGRSEDVYALQFFWPENEDRERFRVDEDSWGYLPHRRT